MHLGCLLQYLCEFPSPCLCSEVSTSAAIPNAGETVCDGSWGNRPLHAQRNCKAVSNVPLFLSHLSKSGRKEVHEQFQRTDGNSELSEGLSAQAPAVWRCTDSILLPSCGSAFCPPLTHQPPSSHKGLAGAVACDVIWSYYREARGNFVPNSNVLALAVVCNCPGVLLPANPLAEIHYGQAATSTRTAVLKAQGLGLRKWLLFSD